MKVNFGKVLLFRILICLPLVLSFVIFAKSQPNQGLLIKSETNPVQNLLVFDSLWDKVNTRYFDPDFNGVDWAKMREIYRPQAEKAADKTELLAILKQMLRQLKTSHLDVWQTVKKSTIEKKMLTDFDERDDILQLRYGFSLKIIEGKPTITEIAPNSSAEREKVQIGWKLIKADGKNVTDSNFNFGEIYEGKQIDLVFEDIEKKQHTAKLSANWAIFKKVRVARFIENNIGYLKFEEFENEMSKWLEKELQKLKTANGIVIDLRENHGGYLEEVKKCLALFFNQDIEFGTFIERNGKAKSPKIKAKRGKGFNGKIVVLVDDESFSGAEIFARLIQENSRGLIIGKQTKGLVLNSIEFGLPADFRVSIAFRDYISPKGYRIEGTGVKPDIEIPVTVADLLNSRDRVLEKALENIK